MNSKVDFSKVIFGANVFGWTVDLEKSMSLLDYALAHGISSIDTADMYSNWVTGHRGGESETVIGEWLKRRPSNREKITIISKVGAPLSETEKGLSKKYIKQAIEASLKRLNIDYLDVYLSHYPDPATPIEETLMAYADLIQEGKILKIGASNYSPQQLEHALAVSQTQNLPKYEIFQPNYSLIKRQEYEIEYRPICEKNQLKVITYFSLAAGFLSGKYRDISQLEGSARKRQLEHYFSEQGLNILRSMDELKDKYQAELSEIALAWTIAQPSITAPIASATSIQQLSSLVKAMTLQLDIADIERLSQVSHYLQQ
ncbi:MULTISPECIES: aldo/keto reductase [unclassified Acinetobacter]|uniref:aldo/keto reductase n=1 Tax=unclassified Acinetobacter TaxID=196816 RepID=UPI002934EE72|nr:MULTISPECIES: aldo/keto reductase [unclassified Acinetobacter]WOE32239.1 aldo/keto reductase [Acinetobacter sp. SAAs470]WOE37709.1 aldo/keto reductase [Acinetobacter sp. SAAs474]